jgi:hypothetical protein
MPHEQDAGVPSDQESTAVGVVAGLAGSHSTTIKLASQQVIRVKRCILSNSISPVVEATDCGGVTTPRGPHSVFVAIRYKHRMEFVTTDDTPVPNGATSEWIVADDQTRIRVARFHPAGDAIGTVVLLNGRTEFIEKYFEVIRELLAKGYAVATLDWRGQGLSDRALDNRHMGHVADFDLFVSDLRQVVTEFVEPNCPAPYRLLCHSMGGNIGMRYLAAYPDTFESAVFSAPMWGIGKHPRTPASLHTCMGAWIG